MKRLLVLVLALLPTRALALEPPPGEDRIILLNKGQVAPFDGQLFDNATALRWGIYMQQQQMRFDVELAAEQEHCLAEVNHQKTIRLVEKEQDDELIADLQSRLQRSEALRLEVEKELADPPWYESRGFWFALGAVTIGGFGILAVNAIH